jgi:hypothetical protein
LGGPIATIHVFNGDDVAVQLRITDSETCQLGMLTQLNQRTRTTYDVHGIKGGYICIGDGATKGFEVQPDGYYMVKGTTLVEDPNPSGAHEADNGFLQMIEAAGREAKEDK